MVDGCFCGGRHDNGIATKSGIEFTKYIWIALFVLIQIGAIICWNQHYRWFSVSVKSCWDNEQ